MKENQMKKKYLIALPIFKGLKGLNHKTILVSATSEKDAIAQALHHHPRSNIGEIRVYDK